MLRAAFMLSSMLVACQDVGPGATEARERGGLPVEPRCPGGTDSALERGQWVKIYENSNTYAYGRGDPVCIVR